MTKDFCLRGVAADGQLRFVAAQTTELCAEAQKRHHSYPVATAALGRLLTAALMLGANLKEGQQLTISINGGGPLGRLTVVTEENHSARGYVENPQIELPDRVPGKLNVGGAVGTDGFLQVTKDLGLKEPYTGSVSLVSGEIGDDIARYLTESEQTPAAVGLGVLVGEYGEVQAAGGYLIQLMPGATEETIATLEQNIASMAPISQLIAQGQSPQNLLAILLNGLPYEILAQDDLSFQCRCGHERLKNVLVSLGKEEIEDLLADQKEVEIVCRFCGEKYVFTPQDLTDLLADMEK